MYDDKVLVVTIVCILSGQVYCSITGTVVEEEPIGVVVTPGVVVGKGCVVVIGWVVVIRVVDEVEF